MNLDPESSKAFASNKDNRELIAVLFLAAALVLALA